MASAREVQGRRNQFASYSFDDLIELIIDLEAAVDAKNEVLAVAESAVQELCNDQDPDNQCWVTLQEIKEARA